MDDIESAHFIALSREIARKLGARSLVLVGMMGCGKTSAGRRLAQVTGLPFCDADHEIEAAHKLSIGEIFSRYGEEYFRDGERRVIARLLAKGPSIIATGGGAFVQEATRKSIQQNAVSVWIDAEFDVLMRRVRRRPHRPLLQTPNPEAVMRRLLTERLPIYAQADVRVVSEDNHLDRTVVQIVKETAAYLTRPPRETVGVALGARSYDIEIGEGLIEEAGARIAALGVQACLVVSDENVGPLYLDALRASLERSGLRCESVLVPAGEASKCYAQFQRLCDAAIAAKIERGDAVVALGGGVVGDLAGFVAASVRRGTRFVQMPTSLLAQVDSSIGGKTGINSSFGKNLVGAFHQPALVLADSNCLSTLPEREFRAGYAEVVKYGLIDDFAFFERLESEREEIFAGGRARIAAIAASCRAKAAVVARDEHEHGDRALLNLGHTFGHTLEKLTSYDSARLIHGEAVAIGMAQAFRFSVRGGLCSGQDCARVEAHLNGAGLPTRLSQIPHFHASADDIFEAMAQDKKVRRGALNLILAHGIGQSFIAQDVHRDDVLAFLRDETGR